jgi:hypothetical protein
MSTVFRYLIALVCAMGLNTWAADTSAPTSGADTRTNLSFTDGEQAVFLAEMRSMLASVQGIMQGMGESDRDAIARFARASGNRMARATPGSIRAKLPPAFSQIGEPTHMMFEELAVRADSDDMDMLARHLGGILQQCMACHAAFRVR